MSCITVRTTDLYIAITYLPADLLSVSGVVKELSVVQKKWRTIGKELGLEKYVLDDIRARYSDPGNRLREVLSERVSHHATTWGDIVAVLRSPHVGQSQLADQLEAKYCPSELPNLHCSTPNAVEGCLPTHCVDLSTDCNATLHVCSLIHITTLNSFMHIIMFTQNCIIYTIFLCLNIN